MKIKTLVALVAGLNCIFAALLQAQAPQMFRYQGRLLDNDALVSGNLNFSFKLYSAPTGGAALYEDAATVTVVDGLYSTMIGDDTSSGGDLGDALNNPAVYLEIEVDGETLAPRERIVSVPYAMNDNGLPSGTVVLSASNPNLALEAEDYSLVYSDVTSPEDWAFALQDELAIPFGEIDRNSYGVVTFGDFVGFFGETGISLLPFWYSRDGIAWNQSTIPLDNWMAGTDIEVAVLNDTLYLLAKDINGSLKVASTSNGADWHEPSVTWPEDSISGLNGALVFANQIWLFGSTSNGGFILKSSDGATWAAVDPGVWDLTYDTDRDATPERVFVVAPVSGSPSSYYIWTTTDGASWTQSSAVLPFGSGNEPADETFAISALWAFGTPEGQSVGMLYKSTDWGDSWVAVSTDLPEIDYSDASLSDLPAGSGLILSFETAMGGSAYISENGSEWSQVDGAQGFDGMSTLDSGQIWLYAPGVPGVPGVDIRLHSIGGPLRSGRLFHYQKD